MSRPIWNAGRRGVTPEAARTLVRTNSTMIAALAVRRGDADAMLCGLEGRFNSRLGHIRDIIGLVPGVTDFSAMSLMITDKGAFFITDTHVRHDPEDFEIAETALMCARHVRRFGLEPRIALVSHSDFGTDDAPSSLKMRRAMEILRARAPDLEVDGEMQADTALSQAIRDRVLPSSRLKGEANVLVMPSFDAANIAYTMTMIMADAFPVGPILIGGAKPAHILMPSTTARGIVNMTAVAVAEAQGESRRPPRTAPPGLAVSGKARVRKRLQESHDRCSASLRSGGPGASGSPAIAAWSARRMVRRLSGEDVEVLTVARSELDLRDQAAVRAWVARAAPGRRSSSPPPRSAASSPTRTRRPIFSSTISSSRPMSSRPRIAPTSSASSSSSSAAAYPLTGAAADPRGVAPHRSARSDA